MAYVVKEIEPQSIETASKKVLFPIQQDNYEEEVYSIEVYRSYLALFHHERDKNKRKRDHLKNIFCQSHPEYQIIIHQEKPSRESLTLVLYECSNHSKAHEAFRELHHTITPLLQDGSVMLTEPLLQIAILPRPCKPYFLSKHLVELMEKRPETHPEWPKVVQALLHSACQRENHEQIEVLVEKGGNLEKENNFGHTPLKAALLSAVSEECMKLLLSIATKTKDEFQSHFPVVNDKNTLATSIMSTSVIPLLTAVPNYHSDTADTDNSVKIWETIRREVQPKSAQIQEKTKLVVSEVDQFGTTPLMIAAEKSYLKSSMYLLLGGADPNHCHETSGNTPLHYAIMSDNILLVKLMLIFDADPTIKNVAGKSPLDLATELTIHKHSSFIVEELKDIVGLQESTKQYFSDHNTRPVSSESSDIYLLSLDGGGIRTFNTMLFLEAIEKRMLQLSPSCEPIQKYFDYIAGTSSGGISALLMSFTDIRVRMGLALVYKIVTDVFDKPLSERGDRIKQYLQDSLGEDTVMADLETNRVIITSTLADRDPSMLHLLTNYGGPRDGQKGPNERKVWEAGRMTSAAPMYFPSYENKFLDGGLMANNPTVDAMVEILEQGKREDTQVKIGLVLSVGTGVAPVRPVDSVDVFVPGFSFKSVINIPQALQGLSSLFDLFVSELTQSNGQQALRAKTWCESIDASYYRLCSPLSQDIDPSTVSMDLIINMKYQTKKHILSIPDQIDSIAQTLLSK